MLKPYLITFSPCLPFDPNDKRAACRRDGCEMEPVRFNAEEQKVAFESILAYCRRRDWPVGALNVRSDRTLIVVAVDCEPERTARLLKAAATQRLRKRVERFHDAEKIWTKGASAELLDYGGWNEAVKFTLVRQGKNDYLSPEEWSKYSEPWFAFTFDPLKKRDFQFDGTHVTWRLRADKDGGTPANARSRN